MSRVVELIAVVLLPTAAGYLLVGGWRLLRWAGDRRWRPTAGPAAGAGGRAPAGPAAGAGGRAAAARAAGAAVTADDRLAADLRRLRAELETTETRTDLPAKRLRLRAVRGAYLDALATACERLDVSPPPGGDRAPQTEIYRVEAALRQRGLDVREPA